MQSDISLYVYCIIHRCNVVYLFKYTTQQSSSHVGRCGTRSGSGSSCCCGSCAATLVIVTATVEKVTK